MDTTLKIQSLKKTDTIYGLLVIAVSNPDYITSNGRTINKQYILKNIKVRGYCPIKDTIPAFP
jgi:hypothetical protein